MKKENALRILLIFISLGSIISCTNTSKSTHNKYDFEKQGVFSVLGIDLKGNIVVYDSETGKKAGTCKERENSNKPCKATITKNSQGETVIRNAKSNQIIPAKFSKKLEIVTFEGSYCVTSYDNGDAYETCIPQTYAELLRAYGL